MTPKNQILNRMRALIQPYMHFDQEGRALDKLAEYAYYIYKSNVMDSGRDFDPEDFSLAQARRATKEILRHNLDDIDPHVNNFPTQPFEPEMTAAAMNELFQSIDESDLVEMNNGDSPVDSPDMGREVSLDEIKKGWPVYVSPGKYALAIGDSPDNMSYVVGKKSRGLYMFDYGMKADELKNRRLT